MIDKRAATLTFLIAAGGLALVHGAASAGSGEERVRGFFCKSKADQIAFLTEQAKGDNEEIAANSVNKSIGTASCAYFLPLSAIPSDEQTVVAGGLVFKLQKYVFLPEQAEYWTGTVFGSLAAKARDQNI
jgi:hypothetical protein